MNKETAERVVKLVAGLIVSDEELDEKEDAFIDKILKKFRIEDRDVIFPILSSDEAVEELEHLPKLVQQETFALLLEAAAVDGAIQDEEREYLAVVAQSIGVTEGALELKIKSALARRS